MSGLDFIQPMGYWHDWKLPPEWVGQELLSQRRDFGAGVGQWVTLGADESEEETKRALKSIPLGLVSGLSWFTYGSWEQKTFDHIGRLAGSSKEARMLFGYEKQPNLAEPSPPHAVQRARVETKPQQQLGPKQFPEDSCVWAIVCLAELYKKGVLNPREDIPVVPVLALHRFVEGKIDTQDYLYSCTTQYLDNLLKFITESGFSVCQLSRLQSYLIAGDPSFLPPKPIVLTLDDGSESVYTLFYPRAKKLELPFTLALVTSWMTEAGGTRHIVDKGQHQDSIMTWPEVNEINNSGLAEVVSHSDAMHYMTSEPFSAEEDVPAETTRQFLKEFGRPETTTEYQNRIRVDAITSRRKLVEHGFRPPTIFVWPYGDPNETAKHIHEEVGFTHFLLFDTPPVMVTTADSREGLPRIPVLKPDESVPLTFPTEAIERQRWWLAFLSVGRQSRSIRLISATLAQLTAETQKHPEAEISRAVVDYLKGNAADATAALLSLKKVYAAEPSVTETIEDTLKDFNSPPL